MRLQAHADRTEALYGVRGEDIHKWIDAYFDYRRFMRSIRINFADGFDPYSHRKYRHHRQALPEVLEAFSGRYEPEVIEALFLQHLRDDYDGYLPEKSDFEDEAFLRRYHRRFPR